ncbi:MAG: signal peptidase II [Kiritimatiellaeota bacterium]|nr:signal peptidase II [Kiritimatiellota bacterium]
MFITALITALVDQVTKRLAVERFSDYGDSITVISRFFELRIVRNSGAAWGMLHGQRLILIAVSVIMLGFVVWNRKEFAKNGRFSSIMTGILAGGILGNLIDRVLTGKVIDFLDFHWEDVYHFPVFNVADAAICVGIFFLLGTQLFGKQNKEVQKFGSSEVQETENPDTPFAQDSELPNS